MEQAQEAERQHQFVVAEHHLREILRTNPQDAQAWLNLASLETVRGELSDARTACIQATQHYGTMMALACRGRIALAGGVDKRAALTSLYRALNHPYSHSSEDPITHWAWGVAAELAASLNEDTLADGLFKRALENHAALHLQAAYLDHLLATDRAADVVATVTADEQELALALRRLLAERRLGWTMSAQARADAMNDEFQVWMREGDFTHGREMAMFYLDVLPDNELAQLTATKNLETQREAEDLALVKRANKITKF